MAQIKHQQVLSLIILVCVLVSGLLLASVVMGQNEAEVSQALSFAPYRQIGTAKPRGLIYNPTFEQLIFANDAGELVIFDAQTFQPINRLYETNVYSHYALSHDGRWLAVAVGRQVDLWEIAPNVVLHASIEPNGSRGIQAPLIFSDDDIYLNISVIVPERPELRRSENDTTIVPYLWDLPNARDEARSTLPNRVDALPFFDYRNGFVITPNNLLIGAVPRRLQVIDFKAANQPVITEIQTERFEQDAVDIWFSDTDALIYHRPLNSRDLYQINGETGEVTRLSLGASLGALQMRALDSLQHSRNSTIIGDVSDSVGNSLLRLLLGGDYWRNYGSAPLTVTLVDVLEPVTVGQDQAALLLYILNETTGQGMFELVRPTAAYQFAVDADGNRIAFRRNDENQPVEIYDLRTGVLVRSFVPAVYDDGANDLLAWSRDGEQVLAGFQRFDAASGAVIAEDLRYGEPIQTFNFTADSQSLVTLSSRYDWWRWDIETGQVVQRERLEFNVDNILLRRASREVYLLREQSSTTPPRITMEVVEVLRGIRARVTIDALPHLQIVDVIPNEAWTHFLVLYSGTHFNAQYSGDEIALYDLHGGKVWHYAGADLPPLGNRQYGWLNDETVYISGEGARRPERIYGLEFDPSGVPTCLVEAFPNDWTQWIDLWERLTLTVDYARLAQMTQLLCAANVTTPEEVQDILFPTATPRPPYVTATPALIAGVPLCLTQRYAEDALGYAQSWRQLTEGMTIEAVAELEALLCEGVQTVGGGLLTGGTGRTPEQEVYLIDMATGVRRMGGYIPFERDTPISAELIYSEFRRVRGFVPGDITISPDFQWVAYSTNRGNVMIERVLISYESLAANATGTAAPQTTNIARSIGVRPTATQAFVDIGGARPTFTPTITPTSPPFPEATYPSAYGTAIPYQVGEAQSIAEADTDYQASGRLLVTMNESSNVWVIDMATGDFHADETIPLCNVAVNCTFNFSRDWMFYTEPRIVVSRPDGTDAVVIAEAHERRFYFDVRWVDDATIEYRYETFLPDQPNLQSVVQRYSVETGAYSPLATPTPFITINEMPVTIVDAQPHGGSISVVQQAFNTVDGAGYKYFIYDREDSSVEYFARVNPETNISFAWDGTGERLFYRYFTLLTGINVWYVYDVATREHRLYSQEPALYGTWSPDGRFNASWYFTEAQASEMLIYDVETGVSHRYQLPVTLISDGYPAAWYWSPDGRYLAVQARLTSQLAYENARPSLIVLERETGAVTLYDHPLLFNISGIITWME